MTGEVTPGPSGRGWSLRNRFLLVVFVGAVLPLTLIGIWLVTSSTRAGTDILRSRLTETVSAEADALAREWSTARSDLLLLSDNDVAWRILTDVDSGAAGEVYLRQVFATVHRAVAEVRYTDANGASRLSLPSGGTGDPTTTDGNGIGLAGEVNRASTAAAAHFVMDFPVTDDDDRTVGDMTAVLRVGPLLPSALQGAAAGAALTVRDVRTGEILIPSPIPPEAVDRERFQVDGESWMGVSRQLSDPPLELRVAAPLGPAIEPFARTARVGGAALVLVALFTALVTTWLTTRLTQSISDAARAAEEIAAGNLDHRIEVVRSDEVGSLGRALNQTAASLRETLDALARQRTLGALGEFATSLAHEVRNGHTAVGVDLQRLTEATRQQPDEHLLALRALARLRDVQGVVDGALQVARSGKVEMGPVELADVVQASVLATSPWFAERAAEIEVEDAGDRFPLLGDPVALKTMCTNLLRNAAQASRHGDRTVLALESEKSGYRLTVRDTGAGMSETQLSGAFEPFFTTRPEGTGLGLPIARQIAFAHGGTIEIQSEVGVGTTVTVWLPARPAAR